MDFKNSDNISCGLCRNWGTSLSDWFLPCTGLKIIIWKCYFSLEQLQPPTCDFVGRIMVDLCLLRSSVEHSVKFKELSVTTGCYKLSVYSIIYWSFLINDNQKNNLVVFFVEKKTVDFQNSHKISFLHCTICGTSLSDWFLLCTGLKIIIWNCYLALEQLQPPSCDFVGRIMVDLCLLRSSVEHSVKFKELCVTTGCY